MKLTDIIPLLLCIVSSFFTWAQPILTLDEAIKISVENNYNIRIAKNEAFIDKTNNTKGNAGFLPELNLNFGNSRNINNTKQELFNGDPREGNNVITTNLNANVQLVWTIFDGMRMFVNADRLKEIENIGQLNTQVQIENTIYQVIAAYYNIEQHKKRLATIAKAIEISKERRQLALLKSDVGTGSNLTVLQADVDINADSASWIRQELVLKNAKVMLNEVMGRNPETNFETIEQSDFPLDPQYNELIAMARSKNLLLKLADENIKLGELNIKQWKTNKLPTLDVTTSYNFTRLKAEIGVLKFNQNAGLSFGITGRWNIFNGFNNKREIQVAKLANESVQLSKEQLQLALNTDIMTLYNNYITSKSLSKVEDENIKIAQQNLNITAEKMRIGTINALELRTAQQNLIDAEFRKIVAEFDARMAKLELQKLSGQLIK